MERDVIDTLFGTHGLVLSAGMVIGIICWALGAEIARNVVIPRWKRRRR